MKKAFSITSFLILILHIYEGKTTYFREQTTIWFVFRYPSARSLKVIQYYEGDFMSSNLKYTVLRLGLFVLAILNV